MGHFSNGTEGESYQEEYCQKCLNDHNEDCPVWGVHLIYNYSGEPYTTLLNRFIPRTPAGGNGKCRMFIAMSKFVRENG